MKKSVKRGPKVGTAIAKRDTGLPQKASEGIHAISEVDPQALLSQAIDKNLPIESMERLLAMRDKMRAEWARDRFFEALAGFQSDCPIVDKKRKAYINSRNASSWSYNYAPVEDLAEPAKPLFVKWGLSWTVKPEQTKDTVTAHVHLHHKDGHEEVTSFTVPIDPDAYTSDPQKAGTALTYATRYAFKSATGIQTRGEDNDAQTEGEPRRREPIRQPQEKKPDQPVPVKFSELSDHDKILRALLRTEPAPGQKGKAIALFTENEQIDYRHEADEAKNSPEELTRILADVIQTGTSRAAAIKGEK